MNVKRDNGEELLPLVDEQGNVVGKATRRECHDGSGRLHPVVHLHVFNSRGELYLQKRPEWRDIQPGKWDTAVGGHVDYGEDVVSALRREVMEELGIMILFRRNLRNIFSRANVTGSMYMFSVLFMMKIYARAWNLTEDVSGHWMKYVQIWEKGCLHRILSGR